MEDGATVTTGLDGAAHPCVVVMWHLLRCCFALVGTSVIEVATKFLSGSKYDDGKKGAFRMWNYDATPEVLQAMLDNGEFSDTTADVITGLQQLIRCMLDRCILNV